MAELITLLDESVSYYDGYAAYGAYPDLFIDPADYGTDYATAFELRGYQNISTIYIEVSGEYGGNIWDNAPGGFYVYAVDSGGTEEYLGEVPFVYPGELAISFVLDPPFIDSTKFLRVYINPSPDGEGYAFPLSYELIQITADAVAPAGAVCFWTNFNKSFEICEGIGGGGGGGSAVWWPVANSEYYFDADGGETLMLFAAGDPLDIGELTIFNTLTPPPFSVGAGGVGGPLLYDPMSGLTLPDVLAFNTDPQGITEAWIIAAYFFPFAAGIVLNVGSGASAAVVDVVRTAGPERDLVVAGNDGNFLMFVMIDAEDLGATEFVYTTFEVTVNGQVLTLHCSHYSVGF